MGNTDRIIRVIVAIILGVLFFTGVVTSLIGNVLIAVAGIFVLTSLFSFCPIYAIFGIRTCKVEGAE